MPLIFQLQEACVAFPSFHKWCRASLYRVSLGRECWKMWCSSHHIFLLCAANPDALCNGDQGRARAAHFCVEISTVIGVGWFLCITQGLFWLYVSMPGFNNATGEFIINNVASEHVQNVILSLQCTSYSSHFMLDIFYRLPNTINYLLWKIYAKLFS